MRKANVNETAKATEATAVEAQPVQATYVAEKDKEREAQLASEINLITEQTKQMVLMNFIELGNVIMGISCTKHPGEDAWGPTITAARLLEKAEKALLRDADAYFAQRAAQEALSLLKANEPQIKQLHKKLEEDEDD